MIEFIDVVPSERTGTGIYETITEFKAPPWDCWIIELIPYTMIDTRTTGEIITIEYRLMRGMITLVEFDSVPIVIEEYDNWPRSTPLGLAAFSEIRPIQPDPYIRLYPNEKLAIVRKNKDYYVVSPLAGLSIKYRIEREMTT